MKPGRRFLLALPRSVVCHTGSHPPQRQAGVGSMGSRCSPTVSLSDSTAGLMQVKEATDLRDAALPLRLDFMLHIQGISDDSKSSSIILSMERLKAKVKLLSIKHNHFKCRKN